MSIFFRLVLALTSHSPSSTFAFALTVKATSLLFNMVLFKLSVTAVLILQVATVHALALPLPTPPRQTSEAAIEPPSQIYLTQYYRSRESKIQSI
jgi:hypothetical protein